LEDYVSAMSTLGQLETHLAGLERVLLGYSGGTDSALLAVAGTRALGPERFLAVIGRSPSYPRFQYDAALAVAAQFGVPVLEAATDELNDPNYAANPVNRCYFCKGELWAVVTGIARERGFATIIDGTNADDANEHRPGLRAGSEYRIESPLLELGWTKAMVRSAARELGLPAWNAPASPCLSSRIQFGLAVTRERLHQVERGEAFLRALGVAGDLRVRHHDVRVRIEAEPAFFPLIEQNWPAVNKFFQDIGVPAVELDPRGYRRGGLLPVLAR
ncbi:MAG: ATP-dependent sacrificial sulfur transferase LarE, partial [Gemmatimonadota bacterium]